jgi:hypothetical protein
MSVLTVVQIVDYLLGKEKGDQYGHPFLIQTPKTLSINNLLQSYHFSCSPWKHQQQSCQPCSCAS